MRGEYPPDRSTRGRASARGNSVMARFTLHDLAARYARRFAGIPLPQTEGAGNAGRTLHPRSRVQKLHKMRTRAYRFSGNTPTFPAQWFDGLCRALPGDEFVLSPSLPARWRFDPVGSIATGSLTSATDARTTRFCRTRSAFAEASAGRARRNYRHRRKQRRSSCALLLAHGKPPCEQTCAPTLSRPPHPIPRS